jgi:NAD(P)-dependent dehydrogenase (short-subunit alcohol dehydrogenase family)
MSTDVTDEGSVRALFDRPSTHTGRVDLVFNNAGRSAPAL